MIEDGKLNFKLKQFTIKKYEKKIKITILLLNVLAVLLVLFSLYNLQKSHGSLEKASAEYNLAKGTQYQRHRECDEQYITNFSGTKEVSHELLLKLASIRNSKIYWDEISFGDNSFKITGFTKDSNEVRKYLADIRASIGGIKYNESQNDDYKNRGIAFKIQGYWEN